MDATDWAKRYRCLQLLQVGANGIFNLTLATIAKGSLLVRAHSLTLSICQKSKPTVSSDCLII